MVFRQVQCTKNSLPLPIITHNGDFRAEAEAGYSRGGEAGGGERQLGALQRQVQLFRDEIHTYRTDTLYTRCIIIFVHMYHNITPHTQS